MVEKLVLKLVNQMEVEKMISKVDGEYYEYALITMIERIITIGTMLLIGLIFKQFISTVCFLIFFLSLRKRTGGYHADEFWLCYLVTIITYIAFTQLAIILSEKPIIMYVMLLLAVFVIEVIGTVNHPNMDMNSKELQEAKKAARLLALMETMVIIALIALKVDSLHVSYMSIAIILCASLLCLAKIIKQEVRAE